MLAAGETLVLTYTGASVHNNQERPPAVPLDELLDAVEVPVAGSAEPRSCAAIRCSRSTPRNFEPPHPVSFDRAAPMRRGRCRASGTAPRPFLREPLPSRARGGRPAR